MAKTKYTYHFGIETLENLKMQNPEDSGLNLTCEDGNCRVKTILQIPQRPEDKEINRINYLICYESTKPRREGKDRPAKQGRPWEEEEDTQLKADFESGLKLAEMAKIHERTNGGIRSRLVRLGLIVKRDEIG